MVIHPKNILIMEISIKSTFLFIAIILVGLSAGLFYAWSVSVIPGTQKLSDATYMETMQSINKAILNPAFFLIFFGPLIFLVVSCIYEYPNTHIVFWLLIVATITYTFGTIGVTALGNVPLNDQLEALQLSTMDPTQMEEFRKYYEENWNRLHLIRTVFSVISFALSVLALLI